MYAKVENPHFFYPALLVMKITPSPFENITINVRSGSNSPDLEYAGDTLLINDLGKWQIGLGRLDIIIIINNIVQH